MKKLFLLIPLFATIYFIFQYFNLKKENSSTHSKLPLDSIITKQTKPSIRVVYFQDVSGSIKMNGVVFATSKIFESYFNEINRDIEINFGRIAGSSANKLITIQLFASKFRKPSAPDLNKASITGRSKLSKQYTLDLKKYQTDSVHYYSQRQKEIKQFINQVDSLILPYRNKLTSQTDLITAVAIADKTFNYSTTDGAQNFLILNSDGLDSYHRTVKRLNNRVSVILVNADNVAHTSVDAILTNTFQSSEQAIQFSLK